MAAPKHTVLALTGPTGIGKTGLSRLLAERLPVEIISADSRQLYRQMDIGTAKPEPELRQEIPHHFISILDPDQEYSAGQFGREARLCALEIFTRGKIPLVVGGSGLYLRAMLEGFFKQEIKDAALRGQLQKRLSSEGTEALYAELAKIDPELAARTHPSNSRRILRGLEVYRLTGRPLSRIQAEQADPPPFNYLKFALTCNRKELYSRINRRVEIMFDSGLVEEVRRLLEKGYSPDLNALNTVGYKEVIAYLQNHINLFDAKELVKRNTRRFAKRQFTWFRGEENLNWIDLDLHRPEEAAKIIAEAYQQYTESEQKHES